MLKNTGVVVKFTLGKEMAYVRTVGALEWRRVGSKASPVKRSRGKVANVIESINHVGKAASKLALGNAAAHQLLIDCVLLILHLFEVNGRRPVTIRLDLAQSVAATVEVMWRGTGATRGGVIHEETRAHFALLVDARTVGKRCLAVHRLTH